MKKLGIVPVVVPMPDVYSALQRGVAQGFAWPPFGIVASGWSDSTKYMTDHAFYQSNNTVLINMDKWNGLPKHLQDLLMATMVEMEPKVRDILDEAEKVEFIKFSPADAKWYVDTAYNTLWERAIKEAPEAEEAKYLITP